MYTLSFSLVLLLFLLNNNYNLVNCANPNYSYHVKIHDPIEANFQEKAETRQGDYTEGFYSVVEPNGALRTVTYTADEWGFKPTITYSYGHPVPPVKKVLVAPKQPAIIHSVPSFSYQQLYSQPAVVAPAAAYAAVPPPVTGGYQYAPSFSSITESRQFIKSPQAYVQPAAPIFQYAAKQPFYQVQTIAPVVKAVQPVTYIPPSPAPVYGPPPTPVYGPPPTPVYGPPPPPPTPEYLPPPSPTPSYLPPVVVSTAPPPTPAYIPPPQQLSVEIRGASKTFATNNFDGGYAYPVPEIRLAYPTAPVKVKKVKIEGPNGEYLPPPSPAPTVLVPQPPAPVVVPPPQVYHYKQQVAAPIQHVKQFVQQVNYVQPAAPVVQKVHYTQPAPPQPLVSKIHYTQQQNFIAPPPPQQVLQQFSYIQPQPLVQKVQYYQQPAPPAPVIQKIQYTHEPARIIHRQQHIARNPQPAPLPTPVHYAPQYVTPAPIAIQQQQVVQAVSPRPIPSVRYEDIVQTHQHEMRYAAAPVLQYVQPSPQPIAVAPALPPPLPAPVATSGLSKQNPLTFNFGYDTGVSKVSHSYYGSGW